jgi:hypothetical protein
VFGFVLGKEGLGVSVQICVDLLGVSNLVHSYAMFTRVRLSFFS